MGLEFAPRGRRVVWLNKPLYGSGNLWLQAFYLKKDAPNLTAGCEAAGLRLGSTSWTVVGTAEGLQTPPWKTTGVRRRINSGRLFAGLKETPSGLTKTSQPIRMAVSQRRGSGTHICEDLIPTQN